MPPVALTRSCFVASVCPFFCAEIVTCHGPPDCRTPLPSYRPFPASFSFDVVVMAAIPIDGIAGIKNVTETAAPGTGVPFARLSFTRMVLLPFRGGVGSVVNSIFDGAFCDGCGVVALAPGGGGTYEPAAACNWLSESIRKFAEVTM